MKAGLTRSIISIIIFVFTAHVPAQTAGGGRASARSGEALGGTWKGPSSNVIGKLFARTAARPAARKPAAVRGVPQRSGTADPDPAVFQPVADSGVSASLTEALASDDTERRGLNVLFRTIKQAYEAEVAKDGKSNNLAAALTFFIASGLTAYNGTDEPSEQAVERFYNTLHDHMRSAPEFAAMSNADKQQMHDWLVLMGGLVMAGYLSAKQSGDPAEMQNSRQLAYYALKIVGVDPSMSFSGLNAAGEDSPAAAYFISNPDDSFRLQYFDIVADPSRAAGSVGDKISSQ
jgi:hypothetical protein